MKKDVTCGIIETNQRWLMCPRCRKQKLARLGPKAAAQDLYLFCRHCRQEVHIAIEPEP